MKTFISSFETIRKRRTLTRNQLYFSIFGILLFLTILITIPAMITQHNRNHNTSAFTSTAIFSDGFESALSWTQSGNVRWYTGRPKTGTHSVRLRQTGSIQKTIPLTGFTGITVSFSMGTDSLDNNNENVPAFYYNGTSWVVLAQINNGSANDNNRLNPYSVTLPATVDNLSLFALQFKINGSANNDYAYVDDVSVTGTGTQPTLTPTATSTPTPSPTPIPSIVSLWPNTTAPANPSDNDSSAVEIGTTFTSEVAGQVTGVKFYKGTGNTGTHIGNLWTTTGTKLATVTFSGESASGWQQINFPSPVSISANTIYVVSYFAPAGHYAGDNNYFSSNYDNAPLHAPSSSTSGGNGVYRYSSTSAFPNSTYQASNYWVDALFQPSASPSPTITGTPTPTNNPSTIPNPTPTLIPSGPINISGQNGTVISGLRITSTSGDCVRIINSTNITIENSEIGPCVGKGVYISGGNNNNVFDNYIHVENLASGCCDSHDGVLTENTSYITIQGNVIGYGETNVQTQGGSDHISIIGNFLVNPRGPFPRGQNFQSANSTNILVENNYALSSQDLTKYLYIDRTEDSINFWHTSTFTAINNYITGWSSNSPNGCGLIADDSSNRASFLDNKLLDTSECGIGISSGSNQVVDGNKVLNRNPQDGGGNTAIYVWNVLGSPACGPVQVSNNMAYEIKPDGYLSGFWNGGGCEPVTLTNNIWDQAAYNLLTPVDQKMPAPFIPPQPRNCVANSPYTNNTTMTFCQ